MQNVNRICLAGKAGEARIKFLTNLRYAQHSGEHPRPVHHHFRSSRCDTAITEGMADGMVPVNRGHRQDIGTEIQAERLSEFDQFTEHRSTLKPEGRTLKFV